MERTPILQCLSPERSDGLRLEGFTLVNCDLTIVGERPHIAPLRAVLRASLAKVLGVDVSVVSVKATTTDGLGFSGRGEGLGAIAVVLMEEAGDHE